MHGRGWQRVGWTLLWPMALLAPGAALAEPGAPPPELVEPIAMPVGPGGLPIFERDSGDGDQQQVIVVDTPRQSSRPAETEVEREQRFAEFSNRVRLDEVNAERVAAGLPRVMGVGNGEPVPIDYAPFQVQVRYAGHVTNAAAPGIDDPAVPRWQTRHICGGTLIDRDWVLTAAHCVTPAHVRTGLEVKMGSADISGTDGLVVPVVRVVRHARFRDGNVYDHDIALLQLRPDARLRHQRAVSVARLGDVARIMPGAALKTTGWGVTRGRGQRPVAYLRRGEMAHVPAERCATLPGFGPVRLADGAAVPRVHPRVFCAGSPGVRTCPGDSGGPVYAMTPRGGVEVVGVVSWAKRDCGVLADDRPAVFTRIAAYRDWINTVRAARTRR